MANHRRPTVHIVRASVLHSILRDWIAEVESLDCQDDACDHMQAGLANLMAEYREQMAAIRKLQRR